MWANEYINNGTFVISCLPALFLVIYVTTLFFLIPVFINDADQTERIAYFALLITSGLLLLFFLFVNSQDFWTTSMYIVWIVILTLFIPILCLC